MKKYIYIFLAILFVLPAAAQQVSLSIANLNGNVEVSIAGAAFEQAKLNQPLTSSDKIRTLDGRAEILFADGSKISLRENSSLDLVNISSTPETQNSVVKLWAGRIKSKVAKLKEGSTFQVHTPKVIAAVKGTEFVVGTTLEDSEVDVIEGIVNVSDILREKEFFLKENEKSAFKDGLLMNPREMSPDEFKAISDGWETSMNAEKQNLLRSAQAGSDEKIEKEIAELKRDLSEVKDRSNLEDKQDLLERISDVQLGKVVTDMNGYRVKSENYVLRPTPDTLQLLNLTKREGGPNAGLSSFEINDTFNKDLPANFMDVKKKLGADDWYTNGTLPEYFLKTEVSAIRNPFGDYILDSTVLNTPLWNATNSYYEQPFTETFTIGTSSTAAVKWTHTLSNDSLFTESYTNASGASTGTTLPYTVTSELTAANAYKTKDLYSDGTYLEKYLYLVDDNGNTKAFNLATLNADLKLYNWEMVFNATEFSAPIDIIAIPQVFSNLF